MFEILGPRLGSLCTGRFSLPVSRSLRDSLDHYYGVVLVL